MARAVPAVVLVGRPNVGKSTLFNRITGIRRSIVAPLAGTTRDAITEPVVWRGAAISVTDTGGLFGASLDPLHDLVVVHGRRAIEAADLIVFIVDGRDGLVPGDRDIAAAIRGTGLPVIVAINKVDDKRAKAGAMEFYQLGFDPVMEISAEHGIGVDDLMDEVIKRVPAVPAAAAASADTRAEEVSIVIIGRPNVGKSSLVNRLLREERVLVSDMPGTTRDTVDAVLKWHRREFRIVDTAGIRKPGRVARGGKVETLSVLVARRAIEKADVAVLVIDAAEGATDQDAAIAGEADRLGCGIIIAANKWDLVKDRGADYVKGFDENQRFKMRFLDYAPILHLSARTGERASKLIETIDKVAEARKKRIQTAELNKFVEVVTSAHPPASPGRKHVRVLYAAQTGVAPPTFVFFTNVATTFHFSYERFLINRLRDAFGFYGTPVRIQVRRRAK